ncbi:MAG: 2-dehydropantoate 2-reductase [Clostridia bacterium]|nr:2-dehydropantoate 2-reductase [Clostridia bacterium]
MLTNQVTVAIYGAGAMGTVLGTFLTLGGVQTHLISRNKKHIEALKEKGATVDCLEGGKKIHAKVTALHPEEMQEKYDVIFLMTKQRDNEKTLACVKEFLKEEGIICTTQNGLPELSVSKAVGAERTYGGVASWGANFFGEGKVQLTSRIEAMSIVVGGYKNDNAKTKLLTEILSAVGKVCGNQNFVRSTDNLAGARWAKLAINAAFSGLSTVTGLTFGEIAKRRKTKKIALQLLRESYAVATADGIETEKMQGHDLQKLLGGKGFFKTAFALLILPLVMKNHQKLHSGMLKDLETGKKCEIDYIDGVVSKVGAKHQILTPTMDKVVEIVHGIENGLYEITPENIDFFN